MFNSNIWPYSAPLRDIAIQNLSDLDFDFSRSLRVKCNSVIGLPVYAFLIVTYGLTLLLVSLDSSYMFPIDIYSNYMFNSPHLALIATQKVFSYLLSRGPNYKKLQMHRMTPKWP